MSASGGEVMREFAVGTKVRLLVDDMDNDENGLERKIPSGTYGTIFATDESERDGPYFHVAFDNGGWLIFYPDEFTAHLDIIPRS
jgi:hypothetical protein